MISLSSPKRPSSRAITAALRRAEGKTPEDLTLAQAYDETQAADLSILTVAVDGLPVAKLKTIMLDRGSPHRARASSATRSRSMARSSPASTTATREPRTTCLPRATP